MELHAWLDQERGRASWLADRIGRSKAAISLWRAGGVPLELIPRIAEETAGQVSTEAMLRHALACKAKTLIAA
jgi:hypothetical protein